MRVLLSGAAKQNTCQSVPVFRENNTFNFRKKKNLKGSYVVFSGKRSEHGKLYMIRGLSSFQSDTRHYFAKDQWGFLRISGEFRSAKMIAVLLTEFWSRIGQYKDIFMSSQSIATSWLIDMESIVSVQLHICPLDNRTNKWLEASEFRKQIFRRLWRNDAFKL